MYTQTELYLPSIFSGSYMMISGEIVTITKAIITSPTKGNTPRMISFIVIPSSGGAEPFKTKIDIAIGGVMKAI